MDRVEFLPCLRRAADGRIEEVPYPRSEPDRDAMPADLYCPSYEVKKGLFGPARIVDLGITIMNRSSYRRDEELVDAARDRLIGAILAKETPEVITASGGISQLRAKIEADEFYL